MYEESNLSFIRRSLRRLHEISVNCQLSCSWSVNHPSINDSLLLIISFPKIACMKSQIYLSSKDLFQDCMKSLSFSKKEKKKKEKKKKKKRGLHEILD